MEQFKTDGNGVHSHVWLTCRLEAKVEKENFEAFEVQSAIMVPIVYRRSLMGIVSFDSVRTEKTWTTDDMALLRIVPAKSSQMHLNARKPKRP